MAYQQYIAQLKTSMEIEPQNCIASTEAVPCSFYINDHTIGFIQSRYIGFYCSPLMLYKYVALPLIIKRVVSVRCFHDGQFFALLSETQKNQQLLTVYQTTTQRILSNITLADEWVHPPTSFQFGLNSQIIHLTYLEPRPKIVSIAWQRGQADDLLQLPEDAKIVSINPYTQSTIISCNSHQIVRFWRRCEEELHSFNPTRLKQAFARKFRNIDIYFIDFFWLTSEIVVGIMNIGELFVFMVPKFIGFVGVSLVNEDRKIDKMFGDKPQISDILTTVTKFQNKICYGTKSGDIVLIELDIDLLRTAQILKQNNQASLSQNTRQQLKLFDSTADDPNSILNNDFIFDLLPSESCKAYNGSKCNVYPHKFVAQSNVGMHIAIRDIQLGPKYAIVQTYDNALYIWNHSAPSIFYDTTLKTINVSEPTQLVQQQITNEAANLVIQQRRDIAVIIQGRPLVQDSLKDIYNSIFTADSDFIINEQVKSVQINQQIESTTVAFTNTLVAAYRAVDIDQQYVDNFNYNVDVDSTSSIQEIQVLMSQCLLNFQTNHNTWSDIIIGLPKNNFNLTPMKQTIYGSRYSIAKNSLTPIGFKYGNRINIQHITHFDENEICNLLSITTVDNTIFFLTIDTLDVIALFNFSFEIQCVQIHPSGVIAYCQYLSGIGSFLINDGMIQIMQHKSIQNIRTFKISNGGGLLAIVSDINQHPEILIMSASDFTPISKIQCHCDKIVYFDFIPGDTIFVSISRDGCCFGHTIYNGERVFDCNIRNVSIQQALCVLGRQLDGEILMEDIQIAKDVGYTSLNVESNYYRKDFEKFVICAIDKDNKFHEIADGIQLHEIQLKQNKIYSVCLVPAPPSYWSLKYQKLFVQQNMTIDNSLSCGIFDQSTLIERQLQDASSCGQKDIIKKIENQYFNEQTIYNKLINETNGNIAEQFSEKTLKFILVGNEDGIVSAYEYPLRDNLEIFSVKLHDEPILSMKIVNGSQLITVSKNQLLISNIRFLLPSEAVFGVLVKNRLTNKLKQFKDQSDNQLLMKMPITRFYPALTYYKSSRTVEAIETINKLLLQTVFNIAEQNNSVEIRLQNIHESFQNKSKIISKEILIMQQKFNDYINPFQVKLTELNNIIQLMDQQFKNTLQQEYSVAQTKFGNKINDIRHDNLLLKDRIEKQRQDTKTMLQGVSVQRKLQLDSAKQQRKMYIQAKEAEIIMIDDNLDLQEKQKDEELKQIAEERQIIITQLKVHEQKTINRQNDALQALSSWKQLQDRRQLQIKKANETLMKQLDQGEHTLSQCISDQSEIQKQLDALMVQLQGTNQNISLNEEVISQLKRDIHQQGKSHFVLSHQIGEIKDEIRPRDDLITDMKDRTQKLTQKLDKINGQWGTTQETIAKAQQEIQFLSNKYNQITNHLGSRKRTFDSIKKQFSNCMSDEVQNKWFLMIVKISEQYRELTKELSLISKQREKDGFIISPDVIDEIDVHNDYLHEKLQNLYDNLHVEDQKFVNIQSYSLDENSAMLIESHKLKDDNLELTAQYQKVMAMIQALKVQQVTQDMLSNEQNLKRTQSQANTFRLLIDKQHGSARPVSQIGNQLEREKTLIRGITSAVHSARSINTMSASSMRGRSAITNSAVSRGGPRPPLSGNVSKKDF